MARIRLELLPHAAHGGKVTRGKADSASVRLSARFARGRARARSLAGLLPRRRRLKEPRYFNGYEIPGILDGWQTSKIARTTAADRRSGVSTHRVELAAMTSSRSWFRPTTPAASGSRSRRSASIPPAEPSCDDEARQALAAKPEQRTTRQQPRRSASSTCFSTGHRADRPGARSSRFA